MPDLLALCSTCGRLVDSTNVNEHMTERHGFLFPEDWTLEAWPDGAQVLINPEEAPC